METFELSVGVGVWFAVAALIALANNGPVEPVVSVFLPFTMIVITYILLQILGVISRIALWVLAIMFRKDVVTIIISIGLSAMFAYILRATVNLAVYDIHLD